MAILELFVGKSRAKPIWRTLSCVVAIVLLSAAVAKAFQLASGNATTTMAARSSVLELALLLFETSFALWSLFGLFPNINRVATILLFSVFACVALTKGLNGDASCGCFGAATVNPWFTFALDATIVAWGVASYLKEKTPTTATSKKRFVAQLASTCALLCALGMLSLGSERNTTLTNAGQIIPVGASVALLPEKWLNAELPLARYCQIDADLTAGRYAIMLRRAECEECRARLRLYQTRAEELKR